MKQIKLIQQLFAFLGLLLLSACTIRNADISGEQNSIQETDWTLISFGDDAVPTPPATTRTSYIHFDEKNGKVKGFAGCNNFFGKYTMQGERLQLEGLGATRMACPDMEVENYLMAVLEKVSSYRIAGDILTLYAGNKAVATFKAGANQQPDHEVIR